jgi:hypothetical protein
MPSRAITARDLCIGVERYTLEARYAVRTGFCTHHGLQLKFLESSVCPGHRNANSKFLLSLHWEQGMIFRICGGCGFWFHAAAYNRILFDSIFKDHFLI